MLEAVIFNGFMLLVVAAAWWLGGLGERIAATAMLLAAVLTPIVTLHSYAGPELGILLVDAALLTVLGWVALRSKAFWPLWTTGFHLAAFAAHLAVAFQPQLTPMVYADTLTTWAYLMLGSLAVGAWREGGAGMGSQRA